MRLTTLGYWGAYPSANEATSGYLLQTDKGNVLLDCGSGVLAQLQNHIALEELDALVISHYHADHIADVYCLQYAVMILTQLGKRTKPLHIYAPAADQASFAKMGYSTYCQAVPIASGMRIDISGVSFSFVSTTHPVPCLAMRIEHDSGVIAYTADTQWNQDVVQLSQHADLLLAECSLYNEQYGQIRGHLTAGEAGQLAAQAGVKKLVLTHLPHYGDHRKLVGQAAEQYQGPIELASGGAVYEVV
ncbi:MBL fold metallo-hydrolase [Brevibacillus humidisoli]|uniref:MBL fold metallo-hydrolase n=1 Tax=Brevibacillus humidisoli TaxID=2895522 RepID=UPI001E36AC9F|nr:MBL fold metallo-hydrolase [Brevibacillus humidisoli]UFJ41434.1 MBL fold metallo-hydrolase [Brevibacillus humidisoli]